MTGPVLLRPSRLRPSVLGGANYQSPCLDSGPTSAFLFLMTSVIFPPRKESQAILSSCLGRKHHTSTSCVHSTTSHRTLTLQCLILCDASLHRQRGFEALNSGCPQESAENPLWTLSSRRRLRSPICASSLTRRTRGRPTRAMHTSHTSRNFSTSNFKEQGCPAPRFAPVSRAEPHSSCSSDARLSSSP